MTPVILELHNRDILPRVVDAHTLDHPCLLNIGKAEAQADNVQGRRQFYKLMIRSIFPISLDRGQLLRCVDSVNVVADTAGLGLEIVTINRDKGDERGVNVSIGMSQ